MSFITPALIGGALLVGVPIALHLIMRRKPQHLVFPALRFVRARRAANQTRLQLRHLILLALRCAAIALLAFALARPVLQGAGVGGGADGPASVALVLDNSLQSQYRHENKTRLEAAKELADWLLGRLPADSPIVVADRSGAGRLGDREGARLRVQRVRPSARVISVAETVRSALTAMEETETPRREVYLFTDRTEGALSDEELEGLGRVLESQESATLYLVDVGVEDPNNFGLAPLRVSGSTIAAGQPFSVQSKLAVWGSPPDEPVSIELWLNTPEGPEKRGEQLASEDGADVEFTLASLPEGVHQGYVRIAGGDPLPADDARFFTVSVEAPRSVLLVAESDRNAVFVREALAPSTAGGAAAPVYRVDVARYGGNWTTNLNGRRAVMLLDPPPLEAAAWRTLANYASRGGGVGVFLGRAAQLDAMNSADAQLILPGKLRWKSYDETYLRPRAYNHPAISQLADLADALAWPEFPVFTYWSLGDVDASAVVVAPYANGEPAILERRIQRGRSLVMTTPLSDPAYGEPWNRLPTGLDPWPFLALMNNLADYLCGATETEWNYQPGQTAVLPIAAADPPSAYVLRLPGGDAIRQTLPPGSTDVAIGMTSEIGNYRVQAGGESQRSAGRIDSGFSVNAPADVGRLARTPTEKITEALPQDQVRLASGREDLARRIDVGRVGNELYPWLITLVAVALAAEQWFANKFYAERA